MADGWDDWRPDPRHTSGPRPGDPAADETLRPAPPTESGLARSARVAAGTARGIGRGGRKAVQLGQRFTRSAGAEETGMHRLLEVHAFHAAGDAAMAVALAGTLFFTVPSDDASGQVALFLVLTMLPFSIVAPLIGPFLDRFRRGRRWAIGGTLAIRAFCCWVLASTVDDESPSFFLAALGCLVASKAYGVTKAAAVPRLLPDQLTLVKANSRVSLTGSAATAAAGGVAGVIAFLGPEWALILAFGLFVVGTILAILLPPAVDSSEGEEQVDLLALGHRRKLVLPRDVVHGVRCNAAFRLLSGFLTIYMAFALREPPDSMHWGWDGVLLMGLVIGAAGVGGTVGTVIGGWTRSRAPQVVVLVMLILDVAAAATCAVYTTWLTATVLGLVAGLTQSLGKLSLDACIQRDVRESAQTSSFARSETVLQLAWVLGGLLGIGLFAIDASVQAAVAVVAAGLLAWLFVVVSRRRAGLEPVGQA